MASRICPSCGATDYGTPYCVSCQRPMRGVVPAPAVQAAAPAAEPAEVARAGFLRRLGAFAIDWLTLSILADLVRFAYRLGGRADPGMAQMNAALGFSAALFILYFTLLTGEGGQTLGKMLLGIRVVAENGSRVGYGRSLLRAIAYIVSFFFGTFLGFLWALWDRKNQAWHDKIAGTKVIRV